MAKDKSIRLSNRMQEKVNFARFALNHKLEPLDLAVLLTLAHKAFKAGEAYANSGSERDSAKEEKAGLAFDTKAHALGFSVTWPGLWPQLADAEGHAIHLPEAS